MTANVLIVDDSATMRGVIRRTLLMSGLDFGEIYEADNGIAALAMMANHSVGLVLTDINMPDMSGDQLLLRMRADVRLRDIPIVVASIDGSETHIRQLLEAGARGYLRKPFQPEALRNVLTPLIGTGQPSRMNSAKESF